MSNEARPNQAKIIDSETPDRLITFSRFLKGVALIMIVVGLISIAYRLGGDHQRLSTERELARAGIAGYEVDAESGKPVLAYVSPTTCKPTLQWRP